MNFVLANKKKNNSLKEWLNYRYHNDLTVYDYCIDIYNEIQNYCDKHNLIINMPEEEFIGHLISVLFHTYNVIN